MGWLESEALQLFRFQSLSKALYENAFFCGIIGGHIVCENCARHSLFRDGCPGRATGAGK